jgi:hypothetical protein
MRAVRGAGNFGIRKAFPADVQGKIAIKNGWVTRSATNEWNINCMAIHDTWTMSVLTRYKTTLGMNHGADIARQIANLLRENTSLVV